MKWHRVWAVTLRHLRQFTRDFNDISSTFVVPFINLLVFGYMGIWMAGATNDPLIKLQLLTGIMVLQLINRSSVSSALSFFEELKSHNITNLFGTPITIHEWLLASCIKALITCGMLLTFFAISIFFIFNVNVFAAGIGLVIVILLAFTSSICLGFLAITVLLIWGMNANSIIWMLAWVVMVVSGALYPITVMPTFLQNCAHYLPYLDLFGVLRTLITTKTIAWHLVLRSTLFNTIYLICSYALLIVSFRVSSRRGLERLMD